VDGEVFVSVRRLAESSSPLGLRFRRSAIVRTVTWGWGDVAVTNSNYNVPLKMTLLNGLLSLLLGWISIKTEFQLSTSIE
jgi:hypothetical protein